MANRLFNIAVALSGIAFCLVIIAWLAAGNIDPRKQFLTPFSGCHLSIDAHGADARLEVFNDSSSGPYSGSIIGVTSKAGNPNGPRVSGIGDAGGIYYRMIRWPNGTMLWTLSLSLAYPLVVAALLPVAWIFRRSRRKRRGFPVDCGEID